jgi:hypothetical protein
MQVCYRKHHQGFHMIFVLALNLFCVDQFSFVDGQALRPALLWMDMRSAYEAKQVAACGDPALKVHGLGA